MSLIFKALQNFQQPAGEARDNIEESPPKRKGYSLRQIFFSLPVTFGVVAVIIAVGIFVSQIPKYRIKKATPLTPTAEASLPDDSATQHSAPVPNTEEGEGNEPALNPPIEPGTTQEITYQVHSPDPIKGEPADATTDTAGMVHNDANSTHMDVNTAAVQDNTKTTASSADSAPLVIAAERKGLESHSSRAPKGESDEVLGHQAALLKYARSTNPAAPGPSNPAIKSGATAPKKAHIGPAEATAPIRYQKRQAARASRHLQISRLANKINVAILANDFQITSKLLSELGKLKGPQHPFVSKLRAYSFIRQERLVEAKPLLVSVLSQRADDLEAGLNMAVIEIKTGQYEDARRRLVRLQELYPEQDQVTYYLRQLPP